MRKVNAQTIYEELMDEMMNNKDIRGCSVQTFIGGKQEMSMSGELVKGKELDALCRIFEELGDRLEMDYSLTYPETRDWVDVIIRVSNF